MVVVAPSEGYGKMIKYGTHKCELRWDQLALQSFFAGFWVGLIGHCCTVFSGYFHNPDDFYSGGYTKLAYGMMFPSAFVAVVYTGTELFTGNTVTMIMLVLNDGRRRLMDLLRVWVFSLFGNLAGAVFTAWFFTRLSDVFQHESAQRDFLFAMVHSKLSHSFGSCLVLAVGCNCLVCLATWGVVITDDGAGKILVMLYTIGVFAMGGYEHIVANFYTITAGYFNGYSDYGFGEAVVKNWIPTLIGNMLGGTVFTGVMWWYALHPNYSDLAPYTEAELARELTKRHASALGADNSLAVMVSPPSGGLGPEMSDSTRWESVTATRREKSSFYAPHHLQPVKGGAAAAAAAAGAASSSSAVPGAPGAVPGDAAVDFDLASPDSAGTTYQAYLNRKQ